MASQLPRFYNMLLSLFLSSLLSIQVLSAQHGYQEVLQDLRSTLFWPGPSTWACLGIGLLPDPPALAYPGSPQYNSDMSHWSNASSLPATCTVQPANVKQIQTILYVIRFTRTPWAVKGAGNCNNNNMSSTNNGVLIDMSKFREIQLSQDKSTVRLGMGLTWGEVFKALDGTGVNVVGSRVNTVGVAGQVLSGGFSWKTNEHGLTIDTTVSYEIVLPDASYRTVTEASDPDLFFALQGGVNNFGIVTHVTLMTHPQGEVWGGVIYVFGNLNKTIDLVANFIATSKDPKATLAAEYIGFKGLANLVLLLFYDAPNPPPGLFDPFLSLPTLIRDVKTRSFLNFSSLLALPVGRNNRATWYSAPILAWPKQLIAYIIEQMVEYSKLVATQSRSGTTVGGNVEPFLAAAYSHARNSAFPHSRPFNSFNGLFSWSDPADDQIMLNLTVEYHTKIWKKALELNVSSEDAEFPPNYSQSITPVRQIYGPNLARLQDIRRRVDPWDIIPLTGGFKL